MPRVIARHLFHERIEIIGPGPAPARIAGLARDLQAGPGREFLDRLDKIHIQVCHQKADGAAVRAAAEAVIKLLLLADCKRGRLFLMERATGQVIFARFFQRHAGVNDIHDIHPVEEFIDKMLGDPAGHGRNYKIESAAPRASGDRGVWGNAD